MKDYYAILQVSKKATKKEIKKAYYRLAKQFHPDVNQGDLAKATEQTTLINEAKEVLLSDVKRRTYDWKLATYELQQQKYDRIRKESTGASSNPTSGHGQANRVRINQQLATDISGYLKVEMIGTQVVKAHIYSFERAHLDVPNINKRLVRYKILSPSRYENGGTWYNIALHDIYLYVDNQWGIGEEPDGSIKYAKEGFFHAHIIEQTTVWVTPEAAEHYKRQQHEKKESTNFEPTEIPEESVLNKRTNQVVIVLGAIIALVFFGLFVFNLMQEIGWVVGVAVGLFGLAFLIALCIERIRPFLMKVVQIVFYSILVIVGLLLLSTIVYLVIIGMVSMTEN